MKILFNGFKIIIIALAVFSSSPSAADVSGKVIAHACYSCHGEKLFNIKVSQTLSADELTESLMAFKTDSKYATIMDRIAKGFTDKELKATASYLSSKH